MWDAENEPGQRISVFCQGSDENRSWTLPVADATADALLRLVNAATVERGGGAGDAAEPSMRGFFGETERPFEPRPEGGDEPEPFSKLVYYFKQHLRLAASGSRYVSAQ
jgi:hypothetical protein